MNSKGNLSKYGENTFIGESLKEILNPMKEETTKQHPWALPMIELVDPDKEDSTQSEHDIGIDAPDLLTASNLFLKFDNPLRNVSEMAPEDGESIKNYAIRVDEKLRDIKASH